MAAGAESTWLRKEAPAGAAIAAVTVASLLLLPTWAALAAAGLLCLAPLAWYAFSVPSRWLVLFFAAVVLLPPLPLPGGDTGPHASVLIAGIGLLVGVTRINQWRLHWSALNLAFAALVLALIASLGFAAVYSGPAITAASAARVVLFSLSLYVYFAASQGPDQQSQQSARGAARALFWIAVIAAVFGWIDFVYQLPAPAGYAPQFLWLESGVYRRAQGLFYEASTLGNFCAFFLVMAGVSLASPRAQRPIAVPALCTGVVLFGGTLALSFSRSSVLACGIAFLALALIEWRRWRAHRMMVALIVLALVAAAGLAVALPEVSEGYWGRLTGTLDNMLAAPDLVLAGRLDTWRTLGAFIADHPWQTFFGIGHKTLPYTEYLGRPVIADNMYLSILVETGVAGLAALLALNAAILVVSWRALRRGSFYGKWMFCFWIGEVFQMLSADILTYWRVLPLYFWVLAQAVRDAHASSADRSVR